MVAASAAPPLPHQTICCCALVYHNPMHSEATNGPILSVTKSPAFPGVVSYSSEVGEGVARLSLELNKVEKILVITEIIRTASSLARESSRNIGLNHVQSVINHLFEDRLLLVLHNSRV